jgi:molybdopterin converting factor small subunit
MVEGLSPFYLYVLTFHYNSPMPIVRFPAVMKYYVDNQSEFSVPASSAGELIEKVIERYPSLRFHLVDAEGNLRRHFNIFVNGTHIRDLEGMDTSLREDDKVVLMASAAGG